MIVGLAGYARAGKDEAAKVLVSQGWERRFFAAKMREFLYRLNPICFVDGASTIYVQDVIDAHGWDGYKDTVYGGMIRLYMQRLGTECGRELISDSIWIDATIGDYGAMDYHTKKIVVSDVRFPNEFNAIQSAGGMLIRIERPGVVAANDHASEHALADYWPYFDAILVNDGSINQLHDKVRSAVARYFG